MVISMKAKNAKVGLVVYLKDVWDIDFRKGYRFGDNIRIKEINPTEFRDNNGNSFLYRQVVIDPKKLSKYQ